MFNVKVNMFVSNCYIKVKYFVKLVLVNMVLWMFRLKNLDWDWWSN